MIKRFDVVTPRDKVQFAIAVALMIFGAALLLIGLLAEPEGQIHNSVLIAYGEIASLAAAVLGIDAVYTNKLQNIVAELRKEGKDEDNAHPNK